MPPDWRLLADLPPGDLQTALLAQADAILDGKSGPEEDRLLLTLPEPARAIWLLNWLDYEVSQGSLLAYLCNSHGRHARLAAGVLRWMGADRGPRDARGGRGDGPGQAAGDGTGGWSRSSRAPAKT